MMPEAPKYFSESQRASFDKGVTEGITRGRTQGKAEGVVEGKVDTLLKLLSQRGLRVTADQRRRISTCVDLAILDGWLDRVLLASSVDELLG